MFFLIRMTAIVLLLVAGYSQMAMAESDVLPHWKKLIDHINRGLDKSETLYQKGERENALAESKNTHFLYYRNSDLEAAIRTNYSMQHAEEINRKFFELSRLLASEGNHSEKITSLVNGIKTDIVKTLPGLPLTPKLLREKAKHLAEKEAERIENKNYSEAIAALSDGLDQVLIQYRNSNIDQALELIRENFYRHWQLSELEASLSLDYKLVVEQAFDSLYKNIQQSKPAEKVEKKVQYLKDALQQTTEHKIQATKKTDRQQKYMIRWVAGLVVLLVLVLVFRWYRGFSDGRE
ncbi:MAG: hypothetical protein CSA50_05920 [Gammaproteobacteria bacterium]|nr:MAG: hypothetical protein CSA50_05920 [Gammaproteobacteria bacterium]